MLKDKYPLFPSDLRITYMVSPTKKNKVLPVLWLFSETNGTVLKKFVTSSIIFYCKDYLLY